MQCVHWLIFIWWNCNKVLCTFSSKGHTMVFCCCCCYSFVYATASVQSQSFRRAFSTVESFQLCIQAILMVKRSSWLSFISKWFTINHAIDMKNRCEIQALERNKWKHGIENRVAWIWVNAYERLLVQLGVIKPRLKALFLHLNSFSGDPSWFTQH